MGKPTPKAAQERMFDALYQEQGDIDTVKALLEDGFDPNQLVFGNTPLGMAVANNHLECADLLIRAGADVNAENGISGNPPLFIASNLGYEPMVGLLLEAGARLVEFDQDFNPSYAISKAATGKIVEMLVAAGSDPDSPGYKGQTPLQLTGKADVAEALIAAGARTEGCFPLHNAASYGHPRECAGLIALGFSPTQTNRKGDTPLHVAAGYGNADVCALLIDAGADIRALNRHGKTPFGMATGKAKGVLAAADEREVLGMETGRPQAAARRRI